MNKSSMKLRIRECNTIERSAQARALTARDSGDYSENQGRSAAASGAAEYSLRRLHLWNIK
jgi:hypothetical protein